MAPRKKTGAGRGAKTTAAHTRGGAHARVTKTQPGTKAAAKTAALQAEDKALVSATQNATGSKDAHAAQVDPALKPKSTRGRKSSLLPVASNRRSLRLRGDEGSEAGAHTSSSDTVEDQNETRGHKATLLPVKSNRQSLRLRVNKDSEADGHTSSSDTAEDQSKKRGNNTSTRVGKARAAAPARSILKKTVAACTGGQSIALRVMLSPASKRGTRRGRSDTQTVLGRLETIDELDETATTGAEARTFQQHPEQPMLPGADGGVTLSGVGRHDVSPSASSDTVTGLRQTPEVPDPNSDKAKSVRSAAELELLLTTGAHKYDDPDGYLDAATPEFLRRLYNRFDADGKRLPMPEQAIVCKLLFEHDADQTEFRLPTQRELVYAREVVTPAFLDALFCYRLNK